MKKFVFILILISILLFVGCTSNSNKIPGHKYSIGDIVAWNGPGWENIDEYEGKVLGQIVKFENGKYLIRMHPYYTSPIPTDPNPPKYQSYNADFIDRNTELWKNPVDWEAKYILDEHGERAIEKINNSGCFVITKDGKVIPK